MSTQVPLREADARSQNCSLGTEIHEGRRVSAEEGLETIRRKYWKCFGIDRKSKKRGIYESLADTFVQLSPLRVAGLIVKVRCRRCFNGVARMLDEKTAKVTGAQPRTSHPVTYSLFQKLSLTLYEPTGILEVPEFRRFEGDIQC